MDDDERLQTRKAFGETVNMTPSAIEDWLETPESRKVGADSGDGESVGHKSGKRIVEIRRKTVAELTDEDYAHMRKVIGYVHRHTAQGGPEHDVENSAWRHSLMNWGHDPLKTG